MPKKTLGEKLKEMRNSKGLTQVELAGKLKIEQSCLSRWEKGGTVPTIDNYKKLSKALGCTIDDLV